MPCKVQLLLPSIGLDCINWGYRYGQKNCPMVGRIPGNCASNDLKMLPLNVCQVKICGLAGTGQG